MEKKTNSGLDLSVIVSIFFIFGLATKSQVALPRFVKEIIS